jgi:Zn-dependent metalloprotease
LQSLLSNNNLSMNGVMYTRLQNDLAQTPKFIFDKAQADKALQNALDLYHQSNPSHAYISQHKSDLMVYVDDAGTAHYVFKTSFFAEPNQKGLAPELPTYLMDAATLQVYKQWNDVRASNDVKAGVKMVNGGGFGGNLGVGQLIFDGAPGQQDSFQVTRDTTQNVCTFSNNFATLKQARPSNPNNVLLTYSCPALDSSHNSVFWNGNLVSVNGDYSTVNNGFVNAQITKQFFANNYNIPLLVINGQPAQLAIVTNYSMTSAIFATNVLSLGDGAAGTYYPFTTRDVVSHELSHAVTAQYSNLGLIGQPGGIGESFGDVTAKAVEHYKTGSNTWGFAFDVMKKPGTALRYLDEPTKDCSGSQKPGVDCSMNNVSQYNDNANPHFVAGIFNKAMYTLATSAGWDIVKAYNIMLGANMNYWTSTTTFVQGACGIKSSASDYGYATSPVDAAFSVVGIDTTKC